MSKSLLWKWTKYCAKTSLDSTRLQLPVWSFSRSCNPVNSRPISDNRQSCPSHQRSQSWCPYGSFSMQSSRSVLCSDLVIKAAVMIRITTTATVADNATPITWVESHRLLCTPSRAIRQLSKADHLDDDLYNRVVLIGLNWRIPIVNILLSK